MIPIETLYKRMDQAAETGIADVKRANDANVKGDRHTAMFYLLTGQLLRLEQSIYEAAIAICERLPHEHTTKGE